MLLSLDAICTSFVLISLLPFCQLVNGSWIHPGVLDHILDSLESRTWRRFKACNLSILWTRPAELEDFPGRETAPGPGSFSERSPRLDPDGWLVRSQTDTYFNDSPAALHRPRGELQKPPPPRPRAPGPRLATPRLLDTRPLMGGTHTRDRRRHRRFDAPSPKGAPRGCPLSQCWDPTNHSTR